MKQPSNSKARTGAGASAPAAGAPRPMSMPKVAFASFIGAMLEWYDFFLFGTASALIFGPLFFPASNHVVSTAAAFAVFGVGFVMRPVGGLVFGHFGDRFGRKATLIATLVIIGVGTFVIGLLPTYASIGIWAPIALIAMRLVQGFGLGGEYGGAALLTIEHAKTERRGFWGSLPQASAASGLLLGTGIFTLMARLPTAAFMSWGWRVPFLISVVLLLIGLVIRLSIVETKDFEQARRAEKVTRVPVMALLRQHPKNTLCATGARLVESIIFNITAVFGLSYVTHVVGVARSVPLDGIMLSAAISIPLYPLLGLLADRVGRREMYIAGCALSLIVAFPFFVLLNTGSEALILTAFVISGLISTLMFSVETVFFAEIFETNVRYTGLSVAYQFSAVIGGFVPLVMVGRSAWTVAGFLVFISAVSILSSVVATDVGTAPDAAPVAGVPAEGAPT
ncbi:MAG: MFS transporter [Stellaceae bacterium]